MGQNVGKKQPESLHRSNSNKVSTGSITGSEDSIDSQPVLTPSGSTKTKKMAFFRKQSDECKKRMDHQLYLAQESPEPTIDLSQCEISEVPPIVFSTCRILNKEALFLNVNWLGSFSGGKMSDMRGLRVLDLGSNELKSLPADFGDLTSLQVLNLENNKLSKLPQSFAQLMHLQTLNMKGNKLKFLSPTVCQLKSLRMLDISENRIPILPPQLCSVRTLETLVIDANNMQSPSKDICIQGTEQIMKHLCAECHMEYKPPSHFLLNILEPPNILTQSPTKAAMSRAVREEENFIKRNIDSYNSLMEKKRRERIELEKQWEQERLEQASMAALAFKQKEKFIETIARPKVQFDQMSDVAHGPLVLEQDQEKMDKELEQVFQKSGEEKQKLLAYIQEVEESTDDLIKNMLEMQEKAKKTEELLEIMERERIEEEQLYVVRAEEVENLRKQEVLRAMEAVLEASANFEKLRSNYIDNKDNVLKQALHQEEKESQGHVDSILYNKDVALTNMLEVLQRQEDFQKDAFEALQLQKDAKHQRISSQICLIEEELASLTMVEIQRKNIRTEDEINILAEKRVELLALLSQLMHDQEVRQEELKKRLGEMEQQKLDGQTDYWLVQYQRLMDKKPQALIDQERHLEISVVTVLQDSDAEDYIPIFARHRITIETLLQMTDKDLQKIGITEMGLRKSILRNVDHFRTKKAAKTPNGASESPEPTAPQLSNKFSDREDISFDHPSPQIPTRQDSILARGMNSECVICLDKQSAVIFLNCGHVCCCEECSVPVKECPLCRSEIIQRIKLTTPGM